MAITADGIVGPDTWNHAFFLQPGNGSFALVNAGNGFYSYYTGGSHSADLAYFSSSKGWKFANTQTGAWSETSYSSETLNPPYESIVC